MSSSSPYDNDRKHMGWTRKYVGPLPPECKNGITLSNGGSGTSLVVDSTGPTLSTKSLTAGTNISFVDSGTDVTINSTASSSPFQQTGSGSTAIITQVTPDANAFIASQSISLPSGSLGNHSSLSSSSCSFLSVTGGGQTSKNSCFITSNNCSFFGSRQRYCTFVSCESCTQENQDGDGENRNTMIACNNCVLSWTGYTLMTASSNIASGSVTEDQAYQYLFVGACEGNNTTASFRARMRNTAILASRECVFSGGNDFCLIKGTNVGDLGSLRSGIVVLTDNDSSGTRVVPSAGNTMSCRFVNGYSLYTNSALTTGVTLAAGSSSWAAVCDAEKKNLLHEADYSFFYEALKLIPCYVYTYKGDPVEKKYVGPTAQDFHAVYSSAEEVYEKLVVDDEGNPILDVDGKQQFETKQKKDLKSIEYWDAIGGLTCALKHQQKINDDLMARLHDLETRLANAGL